MSIEVEVLTELHTIMKQYIPAKDRQECAITLSTDTTTEEEEEA